MESLAAILRSVKEELWAARRRGDKSQEGVWQRRAKEIGGLLTGVLTRLKVITFSVALRLATLTHTRPDLFLGRFTSLLIFAHSDLDPSAGPHSSTHLHGGLVGAVADDCRSQQSPWVRIVQSIRAQSEGFGEGGERRMGRSGK